MAPPILALLACGLVLAWLWGRKPASAEPSEADQKFDSAPEFFQLPGTSVGTLVVGPDRCVLSCNDAFCSFFNILPKDVTGRHITSLFRRSLATLVSQPALLENSLIHAPRPAKDEPLTVSVSVPGSQRSLRLLHTTGIFDRGVLRGSRIEYFTDISETAGCTARLRTKPLKADHISPGLIDPEVSVNISNNDPPCIRVDSSLCLVSANSSAKTLLGEGCEEGALIGDPLAPKGGLLSDASLLAEVRKALRGGGTSQIRRQLERDGSWADISIAPVGDLVVVTLEAGPSRPSGGSPLKSGAKQKQGELFATLSLNPGPGKTKKVRNSASRNTEEQTEFFLQPPVGPH